MKLDLKPMTYRVLQVSNKNEIKETKLTPLDSDKERAEQIKQLYDQKAELKLDTVDNQDKVSLNKIKTIDKEMKDLGVTEVTDLEIRAKNLDTDLVQARQRVPSSDSQIAYSTYRYKTTIRGHLCDLEEGYLKLASQSDSFQNKVYAGNSFEFKLSTDIIYSKKVNGKWKAFDNVSNTKRTFKSRNFDSMSLSSREGTRPGYNLIFTKNEIMSSISFKFMNKSYNHTICSKYYGSMQQYYEY